MNTCPSLLKHLYVQQPVAQYKDSAYQAPGFCFTCKDSPYAAAI
jgi:hypothetical protein